MFFIYTIYKRTNLINGKVYIGQTKTDVQLSWAQEDISDQSIGKAIRQYGKQNFQNEVIEYPKTIFDLNERERYWIKYYDSTNPKKGYNKTKGGGTTKDQAYILLNEKMFFDSYYSLVDYLESTTTSVRNFLNKHKEDIKNFIPITYVNHRTSKQYYLDLILWEDFVNMRSQFRYLLDDSEILLYSDTI